MANGNGKKKDKDYKKLIKSIDPMYLKEQDFNPKSDTIIVADPKHGHRTEGQTNIPRLRKPGREKTVIMKKEDVHWNQKIKNTFGNKNNTPPSPTARVDYGETNRPMKNL